MSGVRDLVLCCFAAYYVFLKVLHWRVQWNSRFQQPSLSERGVVGVLSAHLQFISSFTQEDICCSMTVTLCLSVTQVVTSSFLCFRAVGPWISFIDFTLCFLLVPRSLCSSSSSSWASLLPDSYNTPGSIHYGLQLLSTSYPPVTSSTSWQYS